MENLLPLSSFLHTFSGLRNLHISIHDVSGILSHPKLHLDISDRIHIKKFCDIAKSTPKGYRTCMRCKQHANMTAINGKTLFYGHCQYGLFEVGLPVVENGRTLAVIYVGNIVCNSEFSAKRAHKTCLKTGVDPEQLRAEFGNAYEGDDIEVFINIAHAVDSYIRLILKNSGFSLPENPKHWLTKELKTFAMENYRGTVHLKDVAALYGFNEKYAGRVFKKENGYSFTQYLNGIRIKHAEDELLTTDKSIIDISLDNGFENVTYFNRLFKQKHGITPRQFRADNNI